MGKTAWARGSAGCLTERALGSDIPVIMIDLERGGWKFFGFPFVFAWEFSCGQEYPFSVRGSIGISCGAFAAQATSRYS